jgi:hypothetical protein
LNYSFEKKQHEQEIFNLRGDYAVKMLDLEDKIEKLNKEIESNKKLIDSLNVEINELKVNNFNFSI